MYNDNRSNQIGIVLRSEWLDKQPLHAIMLHVRVQLFRSMQNIKLLCMNSMYLITPQCNTIISIG